MTLLALLTHDAARSVEPEAATRVERRLAELLREARDAFPTVSVSDEAFLAHIAARLPDGSVGDALETLHVVDLYLACALVAGDARAVSEFERRFLGSSGSAVAGVDAALRDEVSQVLRERLLVGQNGEAPRVAAYTGRGPLGGWVRVAAARAAIDLRRRSQSERKVAIEDVPLRDPAADPEVAYIKKLYRREFRDAFQATLSALPSKDRNILRLYFLEGMTHEAIGKLLSVHGTTVLRRLARCRQDILDGTRRLLAERLKLSGTELDSVMALAQSQLSITITHLLKGTQG